MQMTMISHHDKLDKGNKGDIMTKVRTSTSVVVTTMLASVLALVLAFCFTGCSNSASNGAESEANSNASTTTAVESTEAQQEGETDAGATKDTTTQTGMRTVDTDKGPVEIPENPEVIVSDYYLGEMLAVDVKPAIASPYALNNPFLADKVDGIEALNTTSAETSLEMIAETQPDLIITITEADYDKYSKIAPTVYIQDGKRTDEELFRYIADLVGKSDEAEAYLADFNERAEAAKDEIQDIVGDRTVSILEVWPQEIYTMGSNFARGGSILYDMWGLKAPEAIQETMVDGDETYKVISVEALPEYAGDYILYGVLADTDSSFVEDSQLWNNLDAVKNGLVMPYEQVAYMHRDPITLNGQLDDLLEFFRSTADTTSSESASSDKTTTDDEGADDKATADEASTDEKTSGSATSSVKSNS